MRQRRAELVGVVPPSVNLRAHRYETGMAAAGIARALIFFIRPDTLSDSIIGHALRPYDLIWNSMYLLGGVVIIGGLCLDHKTVRGIQGLAVELAGLICFSTALLVQAIAIVMEAGVHGLLALIVILGVLIPSLDRILSIWSSDRKLVLMAVGSRRVGSD